MSPSEGLSNIHARLSKNSRSLLKHGSSWFLDLKWTNGERTRSLSNVMVDAGFFLDCLDLVMFQVTFICSSTVLKIELLFQDVHLERPPYSTWCVETDPPPWPIVTYVELSSCSRFLIFSWSDLPFPFPISNYWRVSSNFEGVWGHWSLFSQ